jgi:GAF domain-containing protein
VASLTDAVLGLQEQHAAVRRLTRLITQDTELEAFFDAVVSAVARILGASAWLLRHDADGSTTALASHGDPTLAKRSRLPNGVCSSRP